MLDQESIKRIIISAYKSGFMDAQLNAESVTKIDYKATKEELLEVYLNSLQL
jgi:hypothetical protein